MSPWTRPLDGSAWPPGPGPIGSSAPSARLDAAGIAVDDIGLRHPTLDDVFLSLTGHVAEGTSQAAETHMAGMSGVPR